MRLLLNFARRYPGHTFSVLAALLVAGIVEGIGMSTILPIVSTTIGNLSNQAATGSTSSIATLVPDTLASFGIAPTIGNLLLVMLCGLALKSVLVLIAYKEVGYAVAHIATDLRLTLVRALLKARWEYYVHQPIGNLANAVGTEAMRASQSFYHGVQSIALALTAMVYAAVALAVSWQATVVALIAGLAMLYSFNRLVRTARRAGTRQTRLLKALLAQLTDSLQSVKPLKSMARENLAGPLLESQTTELNQALQREVLSRETMRALQEPVLASLIALGLYAALVKWTMPAAVVLTLAFLLARVLLQLGKFQRVYQLMVTGESAYWSLQDAIDQAEAQREPLLGSEPPRFERRLWMENVSVDYDGREVLRGLSLEVPVGSFCALVGPSGAGKTTIIDSISGLLRPKTGQIWIDDSRLQDMDLRGWRNMLGYVPQETSLFHDTVLNNVTLGDPALSLEDAQDALRSAGATEFVESMTNGINSTVGERGTILSGGQRQRIVVARALVHKPRLLILDEATSALDGETEKAIYKTLQSFRPELTILAISHRPSISAIADRVYRLQDGKTALVVDRLPVEDRASSAP